MSAIIAPPNDSSVRISKLKFSEPRHNLPGRKGVATAEDRFTISFSRAYMSSFHRLHSRAQHSEIAIAREIPVSGYGIADILAVCWNTPSESFDNVDHFLQAGAVRTRAFECKMTDWRKAMSQALRYRFFAHQAIVVLPEEICERALPFIETFKKIRIGLWGYHVLHNRITPFHTPRPTTPKSARYHKQSVKLLNSATRRSLPIR